MSLQLKPPPDRTIRRTLEALFREARLLERRRRRRRAMVAVLLAGAVAAVAYGASGSDGGRSTRDGRGDAPRAAGGGHVVTELKLSRSDEYDTITVLDGRLTLSGQTVGAHDSMVCHAAVVNPRTLTLSQQRNGSCDDPALSGEPVLPIEAGEPRIPFFPHDGIGTDTVRIAHLTAAAPGYRVGPVLMRSPQISTAHPVWAYGDGYLWLYDGTTRQGSELLRISLTSGAVLARVSMPELPRPILAADNDGLWMAPAVNGSGHVVYHLAPGATTATPVLKLSGPQYVAWMVAAGHDLWLDVAWGGKTQTLLRLHGASASPTLRMTLRTSTLDNEVQIQGGGATVVGDATDGLWTAVPPLSGNTQRIVRIDPSTGTLGSIAVLTPGYGAPNAVAYGSYEAVAHDGSMFLLDPPAGGFSALYRITPTTPP